MLKSENAFNVFSARDQSLVCAVWQEEKATALCPKTPTDLPCFVSLLTSSRPLSLLFATEAINTTVSFIWLVDALVPMDPLSNVASGFAVVSLAVQLAESIKSLYDFWEQIQGAPGDIRALCNDLKVLLAVINDIRQNEEILGTHETTATALEGCKNVFLRFSFEDNWKSADADYLLGQHKINALFDVVNGAVPGFSSPSKVARKWTALKTALRNDKIQKFKSSLEEAKSTLLLASQCASM
jgi:hypothetical protein